LIAQGVGLLEVILVVVYLGVVGYLGWLGFRRTRDAADYLIAGRGTHPFVMAMSYGATFISTSAIVGFAGVAGLFGMSLLWLVFLNIFFGIFIAFVVFGGRTRKMGHRLNAHTFPELLGRRYQSRFIQILAGTIIFIFIPLYAAAVLIGGCEFITAKFAVDYHAALVVFSLVIAAYVVAGGLKGVMYTEAFQGTIMFLGMIILLVFTYVALGGVTQGHAYLSDLTPLVPQKFQGWGHRGWTSFPAFGFGDDGYNLWWIVVSTIILGVGIGVLAQPQLVVRFMTVKSQKELNRGVLIGGLFILVIPGTAYIVGSLSNAYFTQFGQPIEGRVVKTLDNERGQVILACHDQNSKGGMRKIPAVLLEEDRQEGLHGNPGHAIVRGRSIAQVYAGGNPDQIMPTFITQAMPEWFGLLFLLTLLAAAMSTLASQFHALGTSISRDVYEQLARRPGGNIGVTRIGIILGIILAVLIANYARGGYIVARATAIFFGLCSSSFLPAYIGGLFFKRITRAGAIASMITGFVVTAFWLLFVKAKEAGDIGLVQFVTDGSRSILADYPNWPVVDPIVIALPLSCLVAFIVSALTQPPDRGHLERCFGRK
jgi:SSS family solute:Na+ symporter